MYQTVLRHSGEDRLIYVHPDICGAEYSVVNGSILNVPYGTTAFVVINGEMSDPIGPGRYQLFTGVSPFLVRLRNIMTRGDAGISVTVFFVDTRKTRLIERGTGTFYFTEHRFSITMKALAACIIGFSAADPLKLIEKAAGGFRGEFSDEDLDPYFDRAVIKTVREALSAEIGKLEIREFNSSLTRIGDLAFGEISKALSEYGLRLESFDLKCINVDNNDLQKLSELERKEASGRIETDIEVYNLDRVWKGNVNNRTVATMMGGNPSSGQGGAACGAGGMASMMMQMMMLSQMLPAMRGPLAEMTRCTDVFSGTVSDAQAGPSSADAPPMPSRYKRCPSCKGKVTRASAVCPNCGYVFNERRV